MTKKPFTKTYVARLDIEAFAFEKTEVEFEKLVADNLVEVFKDLKNHIMNEYFTLRHSNKEQKESNDASS